MKEYEQEDPIPQGDLALQLTALPRETNGFGDIYGGWLVSQMDLAGTAMASKVAGGRVATVAIDRMLLGEDLPEFGTDLVTTLAGLQVHNLTHRSS